MDKNDSSRELLAKLRSDDNAVVQLLEAMVGKRLRSLIDRARQHGLLPDDDETRLYGNVLASLRLDLRLNRSGRLDSLSRPELVGYLVAASCRILGLGAPGIQFPPPPQGPTGTEDGFLHGFRVGCWSRPLYKVSGDVHAVTHGTDCVWILVADATGHSRVAYAVACAVSVLWSACLQEEGRPESPKELMRRMDLELTSCLPFGEFVEAAVAKATTVGVVTIIAAGGIQFLYAKSPTEHPVLQTASGHFLGLGELSNEDREQVNLDLTASGSEVVLGTDGLFQQSDNAGMPLRTTLLSLKSTARVDSLHETVKNAFLSAVSHGDSQHDDTTIVSLRRL